MARHEIGQELGDEGHHRLQVDDVIASGANGDNRNAKSWHILLILNVAIHREEYRESVICGAAQ